MYSKKIAVCDIESAPNKGFYWQPFKTNIRYNQQIEDTFMLSWSAKFLNSSKVFGDIITPKEVLEKDDKRISKSLHDLFNEADILIAHNGDRFDIPYANTRFILNGLKPPSPYQSIDTYKIAKRKFRFTYKNLDGLARFFGLKGKIDTDFELWKDCYNGVPKGLRKMFKYNKQDVRVLEEVYLLLRSWAPSHPNIVENTEKKCHVCGSSNLKAEGYYYTPSGNKYKTYQCECGAFTKVIKNKYSGVAR